MQLLSDFLNFVLSTILREGQQRHPLLLRFAAQIATVKIQRMA